MLRRGAARAAVGGSSLTRVTLRAAPWAPCGALAIYFAVAVVTGLPALACLRALVAVVLTQVLPGMLGWRAIRPLKGWWVEDLAMGLALGAVVAIVAQVPAGRLDAPWIAAGTGPCLGVVLLALPETRRRVLAARTEALPLWWGTATAAVSLCGLLTIWTSYSVAPLGWSRGFRLADTDMPFHLALSGELAQRGPGEFPYVEGEPLHYHWFAHAWTAQIAGTSGTGLDQVLYRFFPAILSVAAVVITATAAVRVSGRPWAGPLAAFLTFPVSDLDVLGQESHRYLVSFGSPTLTLSLVFVPALVTVLWARWHGSAGTASAVVLAALGFAAASTKGSALPILVAGGLLAAAFAVLAQLPERGRVVIDVGILVASLVASLVVIFAGASGGLRISLTAGLDDGLGRVMTQHAPDPGAWGRTAILVIVVVMTLARGAGLLAVLRDHDERRNPMMWLLAGAGLAGTAALLVFTQPGQSEQYFALNARQPLGIGSAAGLLLLAGKLAPRARAAALTAGTLVAAVATQLPVWLLGRLSGWGRDAPERALRALLIAAVCVAAASLIAALVVPTGRLRAAGLAAIWAVAVAGAGPYLLEEAGVRDPYRPRTVQATASGAFSADQIVAARWLRDHSGRFDVIATNRHCYSVNRPVCDGRRFLISAYTERRVLVEGWAYTPRSPSGSGLPNPPFWDLALLARNDAFFHSPTLGSAEFLRSQGVRWLFVDKTRPGVAAVLGSFARLRFSTQWAGVYELS